MLRGILSTLSMNFIGFGSTLMLGLFAMEGISTTIYDLVLVITAGSEGRSSCCLVLPLGILWSSSFKLPDCLLEADPNLTTLGALARCI